MDVHLVDGTYELFRYFYALPSHLTADGREVAAVRGAAGSVLSMIEDGATHLAVATDHVVESFRNDLWPGYKDGSDMDPAILSQFDLLEDVLTALGVTVWPMIEFEADDALAAGAQLAAADPRVDRVFICTPDKDLAQCVDDRRVVQFDRRKGRIVDQEGVRAKFGVEPGSIADWLALVGDAADGFPGLPGWGAKSAATVLARYGHIEEIPLDPDTWDIPVRGAARLAGTLAENLDQALLFRRVATVDRSAPVGSSVDELAWSGPASSVTEVMGSIDAPRLAERARAAARSRRAG